MIPTYQSGSLLYYANCQGYPAGPGWVGDLSVTTDRGAIFRGHSLKTKDGEPDESAKQFYENDGSPENCERVLGRHYHRLIARLTDKGRSFGAVLSLTTCDETLQNRLFNYPNNPISIVDARTLTAGPSGFADRATVDLVDNASFRGWWKSIEAHVRWLKSLGISSVFADNAFAAASSGGTIPEDVQLRLITKLYGLCKELKLTLDINATVCPQHWQLTHVNHETMHLMGQLSIRCHGRYCESYGRWPWTSVELLAGVENERRWVSGSHHRKRLVLLPVLGGPSAEWLAAFAMMILSPDARVAVSHPWFAPTPEWADWPARLGKPKGPAEFRESYDDDGPSGEMGWFRIFRNGSAWLGQERSVVDFF